METKYQTSFIPKKPIAPTGPVRSSRGGGIGLFTLISVIIFLISLGLGGYVYLEKNYLINKISVDQTTIEDQKGGLVDDATTIESLIELNSRIKVAKELLDKHISVSPIFNFLQQTTLKSVRFKNFTFTSAGKDVTGASRVSVLMSGIARDWETVASQADEFGKVEYRKVITEPKISNLTLNADGSITFSFSAYVTPSFLVYGSN
jgi:hypothetical protein